MKQTVQHTTDCFRYSLSERGEAEITRYTGQAKALTIPRELGGAPVTAIGNGAFEACESLESVVIPEGVLTIGRRGFNGCRNLRRMTLPGSLEHMHPYALYGGPVSAVVLSGALPPVSVLQWLHLGTQLTLAPKHPTLAMTGGAIIEKRTRRLALVLPTADAVYAVPDGVKHIGCAFAFARALRTLVIPDSVTHIDSDAFESCPMLSGFKLSDSHPVFAVIGSTLTDRRTQQVIWQPAGKP